MSLPACLYRLYSEKTAVSIPQNLQ